MLRSCGPVSARFTTLLMVGLFVSTSSLWCIPPSVAFNGVATVATTGSVGLNHPKGLVVASDGDVYIADTAHHQIVKVTPDGSAAVVAITGLSTGLSAPEGVALDDFAENTLDTTPCTSSTLLQPGDVCDVSVFHAPKRWKPQHHPARHQ